MEYIGHDIIVALLWASLFAGIAVLVLGAKNNVVIYMGTKDLAFNMLPAPVLILFLLIAGSMGSQGIKTAITDIGLIVSSCIIVYNFYTSIQYNSFLPLPHNLTVAVVKALFSIISLVLVLFWVSNSLDSKTNKKETLMSGAFLMIAAAFIARLINGATVYAAYPSGGGRLAVRSDFGIAG